MKIEEELVLRLLKQRVPLMVEHKRLKKEVMEMRKNLYQVAWKLKELDDEILARTTNETTI